MANLPQICLPSFNVSFHVSLVLPEVHLDVSTLQRPVLHLEEFVQKELELYINFSALQRSLMYSNVSKHRTQAAPGRVYTIQYHYRGLCASGTYLRLIFMVDVILVVLPTALIAI